MGFIRQRKDNGKRIAHWLRAAMYSPLAMAMAAAAALVTTITSFGTVFLRALNNYIIFLQVSKHCLVF